MAKSANQKMRLLVLRELLLRETDEEHLLTIPQMLQKLEARGILVERKSLYDDIDALREAGDDVELIRGRNGGYYMASRLFEMPELKLLVDAVQSSRFITAKKSSQLIKKLENLVSVPQAKQLQRQVEVNGRVKSMNESIYYVVDAIHTAISGGHKISFQYSTWVLDASAPGGFSRADKHEGKHYIVSPWALVWREDNYYLIAFEEESQDIRHFRVDKMHHQRVLNTLRDGQEQFDRFDLSNYMKEMFGMFSGEAVQVYMELDASLVGVLVDRFGRDITLLPLADGSRFGVNLTVVPGPTFYGWVMSFGGKAVVKAPEKVRQELKDYASFLSKEYEK